MLRNARKETLIALILIAPFVAIYGLVFVYPTIQMFLLSVTDAPLIGSGKFVGISNYTRLPSDSRFVTSFWNTAYFVLLSVVPGTAIALAVALGCEPAFRAVAVLRPGLVLSALYSPRIGGLSALGLGAQFPVRARHACARFVWH